MGAAHVTMREDEIQCHPNPGHPDLPSFSVKTIHISCKSDAYRGTAYDYAGVIIYSSNGKSEWQTANGTRCKSGYLVIMDTETEKVRKYLGESPGCVHGAVYRSAFGEQRKEGSVIAEGFSVRKGVFKIHSGCSIGHKMTTTTKRNPWIVIPLIALRKWLITGRKQVKITFVAKMSRSKTCWMNKSPN